MDYYEESGSTNQRLGSRANSIEKSIEIENMEWHLGAKRFGSSSSQTSQTSGDICRICHCESDTLNPLLTPCYCSGSLKYVHQQCLQQWLTASETNACELCKFPFIMHTKIKPFNEWRSLEMSGVERRRLFCAVLFHFAAALCVIWSLCVLIERAAEEVKKGQIGWPFWTKLVVVTVGVTGGIVFMYIQCKRYLNLCHRWRARNRILLIQNAPEKIKHPQSPTCQQQFQQSHQQQQMMSTSSSLVGPGNPNVRRINSSIQVITAPLNNVIEQQQFHQQNSFQQQQNMQQNQQPIDYQYHHHYNSSHQNAQPQNPQHCEQIVANIENNSINYELDDDISYSQISFKHHLRQEENTSSRGSMHNVYNDNTSISTTNTSTTTKNLNLSTHGTESDSNYLKLSVGATGAPEFDEEEGETEGEIDRRRLSNASSNTSSSYFLKEGKRQATAGRLESQPQPPPLQQQQSSVFLENRDILNDQNYPKLYNRHSSLFMPNMARASRSIDEPEVDERLRKRQQEMRRYSDTKLLNNFHFENEVLLNRKPPNDLENILGSPTIGNRHVEMGDSDRNNENYLVENCDENYDPLELNIQKILELDLQQQHQQQNPTYQEIRMKRSLDNVLSTMYGTTTVIQQEPSASRGHDNKHIDPTTQATSLVTNNRTLYKSLPNLNDNLATNK